MSLVARALHVRLGGADVLSGVSAALQAGHVTAILGPNGAGKSTLLACLAGLRRADAGEVMLDDQPLATLPARTRAQRIGFLPQVAEVNWDVDVQTLVALGRFPHSAGWGETEADRAATEAALAATDMGRLRHRVVNTLSGGERGRALLARVLAGTPQWLLADEPLASLDPAHQIDVLDQLRNVAALGTGVVVVLHDLNQAARVADDILMLREGVVAAAGPPDAVLTPETLAAVYGIEAQVHHLPDGRPFIATLGRQA